jgi:alkylation response protein AidB-like acyl-CoA dehydrogenase
MTAEDYAERARGLAPMIEAAAPRMERERQLTSEIVAALHDAGLYRVLLPRTLGGGELAPADFVRTIEAVAQADASTAWCLAQAGGCATAAAYLEPAVARAVFGPRDAVLAWGPPNGSGRARPVDGGYLLTGTWQFASGSRHATWLGAHAARTAPDGTPLASPGGITANPTLLFPRASATISDTWQVIGLKATGSDTYAAKDLFVPASHVLQRDDPATRREAGPLYRFTNFQLYGAAFAGVALGIARSVQDAFLALAQEKTPFLAALKLRDSATIQLEVAQSEAKLRAARLFLLDALSAAYDEAARQGAIGLDRRVAVRLASTSATHWAKEVVDACYNAAGATAIFEANPFERRFRDIHAVAQQSQARPSQLESAGKILLGFDTLGYAV